MSVQRESTPSRPSAATPSGSSGKKPVRQPNRAQVRAMQVRTAANPNVEVPIVRSVVDVAPAADDMALPRSMPPGRAAAPSSTLSRRQASRARSRPAARPVPLTRAEEYRFIRSDLNRLLMTASLLGAMMIALLFVLEL